MRSLSKYSVVDLFCGIGGLTRGLIDEGFGVVAGIDIDSTCQNAYEKNNSARFLAKDVSQLTSHELSSIYPKNKKKILVGCAPCQPFSVYVNGRKEQKHKWSLLESFTRLVQEVNPEIVSMENVPQLIHKKNKKTFLKFVHSLEESNFKVKWHVVDSQLYGVPQRRKRLVLFASKFGYVQMIAPTHKTPVTVREAIGHLPRLVHGSADALDPLHSARKLSPTNLMRIRHTPEGGSWRQWPESLILDCHKKGQGRFFGSVYGRMKWDDVSPTMTTYCNGISNGRFGHPEQDRAISLREAALLQSFPPNYDFRGGDGSIAAGRIARHIGNAVPVKLGRAIAASIKQHLQEHESK